MKKLAIIVLKIGLSVGILAWLFSKAMESDTFDKLKEQFSGPGFNWSLLVVAFACMFTSALITFVRWFWLVRALGLPFTLRQSLRLGFLGYLYNLAPMGIVGGDLLKAVMLARQQPRRRAQAVATVAVDRIIGLYALFLVASLAIVLSGFWRHEMTEIRYIALATLVATATATAGMGALFIPGVTQGRLTDWLSGLRYVGRQLGQLIDAVRMYRSNPGVLAGALAMSFVVHALAVVSFYLVTLGIFNGGASEVTLAGAFVVVPLANITKMIPLNVGPLEFALDALYVRVFHMAVGQGLVVALGCRIVELLIALVGLCYYFGARRELTTAMHEVEEAPPAQRPTTGPATNYCSQPRQAAA